MSSSALKKLKPRRRRFVELYLGEAKFNASEAARLAGYGNATGRAGVEGWRLLQDAAINDAIDERLSALSMTAGEATMRLTQWGRGSIEPFQRLTADGSVVIDLATAEAQENLHLVRELEVHELRHYDKAGNVEAVEARTKIKLHDAKDATIQMGKIRGLYVERDTEGNPLPPTINIRLVAVPPTPEAAVVAKPVVRALLNGGNGNGSR